MSLMGLSTELRLIIFEYLDSAAMYRLMLTSTELRREAEPYLYRNISIIRPDRLKHLLVKVLSRRELIKDTRSFSLKVADPEGLLCSEEFTPDQFSSIESVIREITGSELERIEKEWLAIAHEAPIRDVSLSLVLCLAMNLEELHLVFAGSHIRDYEMLYKVLGTDWQLFYMYHDRHWIRPFRKLQSFSLDTRSDEILYLMDLDQWIPRSTSLHDISLSNLAGNDETIPWLFRIDIPMAYHTLYLDNIECEWYDVHRILKEPCFQHLKRFAIKNLPYRDIRRGLPPKMSSSINPKPLSEVIVQHLPELEGLEISNVRFPRKVRRVLCENLDLESHQKLTKLVIDYDLLVTDKIPPHELCLLSLYQTLPPRLRSMTLTGVNEISLKVLLGLYENYSKYPGPTKDFVSELFRVDGIKKFDLELNLWKERVRKPGMGTEVLSLLYGAPLSGYAQRMIPRLVETVQEEKETTMHVWRQDREYGKRLLCSSGYTPSESVWYERDDEDASIWYKWGDRRSSSSTSDSA